MDQQNSEDPVPKWIKLDLKANNLKRPHDRDFQKSKFVSNDHFIMIIQDKIHTFHLKELYWSEFDLPKDNDLSCEFENAYLAKPGLIVDMALAKKSKDWEVAFLTFEAEGVPKEFSIKSKVLENPKLPSPREHIVGGDEAYVYLFNYVQGEMEWNMLHKLNLETGEISKKEIEGPYPGTRYDHKTVLSNDKLFVFGGRSWKRKFKQEFFDLWVLHLGENKWEKLEDFLLSDFGINFRSRESNRSSLFACRDEIFLGFENSGYSPFAVISYHLKKKYWTKVILPTNGPITREPQSWSMRANQDLIILFSRQEWRGVTSEIFSIENPWRIERNKRKQRRNEMQKLFEGKTDPDVVFKVEDQELPANKQILSYRSSYFKNVFSSNMMESHSDVITINNVRAKVFQALLQDIYLEDFEIENDIAEDLLKLCHEYMIEDLKKECEDMLICNIKLESVVENVQFAEKYEAPKLRKACLDLIVDNVKQVFETQNYRDLATETMLEILDLMMKNKE